MRYFVFSDIHGNIEALEMVLEEVATYRPDIIVSLGDVVGYGANPNECIQRVSALPGLLAVMGNHDAATIDPEDRQPLEVIARMQNSPLIPLVIKDATTLDECAEDAPWKAEFDKALAGAGRGRWSAAVEKLLGLAGEVGDVPAIWHNLGILRGWLGDWPGAAEALRKYASLDVSRDDAVEAEALAMALSDDPLGDRVEVVDLIEPEPQGVSDGDRKRPQPPLDVLVEHPIQATLPSEIQLDACIRQYLGFLKTQVALGALLSALFASAGTMGFIAFLGVWLSGSFGISASKIGLVFLIAGGAALLASPLAGSLADRIGKRTQFVLSCLSLSVFLFVLPGLRWGPVLFAVFGVISLSAAFRQGPMEAIFTEIVPSPLRGRFIALKNSFSQLGIGLATMFSGILFEIGGYTAVCILGATANLLAAGSMLLTFKERQL